MDKILLLGAYGQSNLGDELLLKTFLDLFKGYKVVVNSTNPEQTTRKFKIDSFNTYKEPIKLLKNLLTCRIVAIGGGSQFKELPAVFGRNKLSILISLFVITFIAKIFFKKVYFLNVGAGPLKSSGSKLLTKVISFISNKVIVRDTQSYELMKSIIGTKKLVLAADALFYGKINKIIPKKKIQKVVMVPNFHTSKEELIEVEKKIYSKLVKYFEQNKIDYTFVPFQIGFTDHDDLVASKAILESADVFDDERITIVNKDEEIFQVMSEADLVIGVRLHSLIISSLCSAIPIGISYDPKVKGFMQDIGMGEFCFDLEEEIKLSSIISKLEYIEKNYEKLQTSIYSSILKMRESNYSALKKANLKV